MKKIYLLTMLFLFAFITNAQVNVQGFPRTDLTTQQQPKNKKQKKSDFSFSDIKYWVGTGSNQAAFAVQWNDKKNPDVLVWGFRWDGEATGEDMIKAIAKTDKRFFTLLRQGTQFGTAIGGLGFDLDGKGSIGLYKDNNLTYPFYPLDGIINTVDYDFDYYTVIDASDHWQSGWKTNGYWSYWVRDSYGDDYGYSNVGASSRILENGSWDLWNFDIELSGTEIATTFTAVTPYSSNIDFTKGYFMVNEEWFGHTNGSVNFVDANNNANYRVYSNVNNNEAFGATTQYGTIYGDKFYFISKQEKDRGDLLYKPGGRLVIADAKTMKKIAQFDNIGGGDGRSFLGVDSKTGYIGAANGIFEFDIENLKVKEMIEGTGGGSTYSGQIGNMIRTPNYVYAVKQSKGILVIDPKTKKVTRTLEGAYISIIQAKDGSIWAIQDKKLININEKTFTITEYPIPTTRYIADWGSWRAGSFTYSTKQNALFWINSISSFVGGTQVVKFDVTTKTFNEKFALIPGQTDTSGTPLQFKQIPYGAALRIDPVTDNLILNTTESGGSSHYQKNWVHTYDNTGELLNTITLNDYYWFPAITVFPDIYAPVVSSDFPSEITLNAETKINLKNVATDQDNLSAAIVKSIRSNSKETSVKAEINDDQELVITPLNSGVANIEIDFTSNGKVVTKTLAVTANFLATTETTKVSLSIYPNPVSDVLKIKSNDKIDTINIFDFSGKLVSSNSNANEINVSNLIKGNYIIQITTDKKTHTEKFIKK
ncbi:T9SS type A sorting domain-containing protein [Chryseobacterium sp. T1]